MKNKERIFSLAVSITTVGILLFGSIAPLSASSANNVNVWWPTDGAHVTGVQPFKAMISGVDVSQYDMYWQVDGGALVPMSNNYTDYQHKEASVDLSSWSWHGQGPYVITFVAKQQGTIIAQQSEMIYNDGAAPITAQPTPTVTTVQPTAVQTTQLVSTTMVATTQQPAVSQPVVSGTSKPVAVSQFYVDPYSSAARQAQIWRVSYPTGAAYMDTLAAQPTAAWFGDWNSNVASDVRARVSAATNAGATAVLVAYNIPQRDCGGFSAGGTNNPQGYTNWINAFASGIGSAKAVVVLEPDSLAQISCLSSADQNTRLQLLSQAVNTLKNNPNTTVYLDAGHAGWVDAQTMAGRLKAANVSRADGFALNVSNFDTTSSEVQYGQQVSAQVGSKHFVIDTSRNGNGSNGEWCNPWGRAIGIKPTTQTGNALVDAYLWIKTPGESDGYCNGGPSAGTWWPDYAVSLVQNAH